MVFSCKQQNEPLASEVGFSAEEPALDTKLATTLVSIVDHHGDRRTAGRGA